MRKLSAVIVIILCLFAFLYLIIVVKTNNFTNTPIIPSKEYNLKCKTHTSKDSLLEGDMLIIKRDQDNNIYVEPATYDNARYFLEAHGEG